MDEHPLLEERLRSIGRRPVPAHLVTAHLARIATVTPRSSRARGVTVAAAVVLLTSLGVGAAAAVGGPGGTVSTNIPAQVGEPTTVPSEATDPPEDTDDPPTTPNGTFSCYGPPPFAGVDATEAEREADAEAFAEFRETQCVDSDETGVEVPGTDPCYGPPPFAGVEATDGTQRAQEATDFGATRTACGNDDAEEEDDDGSGPPSSIPTGPPPGTPSGPPPGTPTGPPDGTPSGPPAGTPSGPPDGTPSGPPTGIPGGGEDDDPDEG